METIAQNKIWTDDELLALPKDGNKYEVMNGELIASPAGIEFSLPVSELFEELKF